MTAMPLSRLSHRDRDLKYIGRHPNPLLRIKRVLG